MRIVSSKDVSYIDISYESVTLEAKLRESRTNRLGGDTIFEHWGIYARPNNFKTLDEHLLAKYNSKEDALLALNYVTECYKNDLKVCTLPDKIDIKEITL